MDPLPAYVGEWFLAKWMGVTRDVLDDMPLHEVEQARIVMQAEQRAQKDMNEQASAPRKGRRR